MESFQAKEEEAGSREGWGVGIEEVSQREEKRGGLLACAKRFQILGAQNQKKKILPRMILPYKSEKLLKIFSLLK